MAFELFSDGIKREEGHVASNVNEDNCNTFSHLVNGCVIRVKRRTQFPKTESWTRKFILSPVKSSQGNETYKGSLSDSDFTMKVEDDHARNPNKTIVR
eukprot:CAMPEP_0169205480 /NCGR_PEP_ID=MMETSP1016-20121227/12538_1 /TAXON_ID=342587 /ORGANISM="Karlodinium micrum, Strain CCMP2283" /LENGTH=97 /DNA_ID=CAMNT_0009282625 /DNA_START=291 /DNA_END=580 /DNA_ORIENTATION=+